jgi:hypothetical protein
MKLTRPLLAAIVAVLSLTTIVAVAQAAKRRAAADLLPDLVQEPPAGLDLRIVNGPQGEIYRLGFSSAVHNAGAGPLEIHAARASTATPAMSAEQLVHREDGTVRRRPRIGVVQYTRSPTHSHWHYLRFERYEIRSLDGQVLVADQKSGFCVGDRYDASGPARWRGEPKGRPWSRECGKGHPEFKKVTEGMSVGWGDNYEAHLEGQYLDLNGLPAGQYLLVHRANADRRILEERYDNNEACVKLNLEWPDGPASWPNLQEQPC